MRRILVRVEIAVSARCHNCFVPALNGSDAALGSAPRHYCSIRCKAAVKNLVPAYNLPALAVHKFLYALYEVALQFVHILEPLLLHALLAQRAVWP